MSIFSRSSKSKAKKNPTVAEPETTAAPAMGNAAMADAAGISSETGRNVDELGDGIRNRIASERVQSRDPSERMESFAMELGSIQKGGWRKTNSEAYENIITKLNSTMLALESGNLPTGDVPAACKCIMTTVKDYNELVKACETYIKGHKNPKTTDGKRRRDTVKRVLEQAQKDMQGMRDYYDVMPTLKEEERVGTLREVLGKSRRRVLHLKDKKESQLNHVGGAASYLGVIEQGDLAGEDAGVSGYFKENESYTNQAVKLNLLGVVKTACQRALPDVADVENTKAYATIMAAVQGAKDNLSANDFVTLFSKISKTDSDEKTKAVAKVMGSMTKALGTHHAHLIQNGGLDIDEGAALPEGILQDADHRAGTKGKSVNLSGRNVATSRLANMLGIGHLIAQSETAELVDADGTSRTGNLMQEAKGSAVTESLADICQDEYDTLRDADVNKSMHQLSFDAYDKVTPRFMRDVTSLQVLDSLTGQMDRHAKNYYADKDESGQKLDKVTGIDNDYSFTNTSLYGDAYGNIGGAHGLSMASGGKMSIPYMDADLARNIQNLDMSEMRLMLEDVLEPWAIDALVKRFEQAREVIREAQADKSKNRFLENEEEWNRGVFDEFAAQSADSKEQNYLSRINQSLVNSQGGWLGATQKIMAARYNKKRGIKS